MKLGSIFASAAGSSGGNSTTRIAVPLSGGDSPMGLAALSSLNENPGGEESVIHRFAAGMPDRPGLRVRRPSNSAIALFVGVEAGHDAADISGRGGRARQRDGDDRPECPVDHCFLPCVARTASAVSRAGGRRPVALDDTDRDRYAWSSMRSCLPK